MKFLKKYKIRIIISTIACLALAVAFLHEPEVNDGKFREYAVEIAKITVLDDKTFQSDGDASEILPEKASETQEHITVVASEEEEDQNKGDGHLQGDVFESEQGGGDKEEKKDNICTLSVRCDVVLSGITDIDEGKKQLIPRDGIIFYSDNIEFFEDETVFNILLREMKKNKIHMDFVNSSVYNSVYVRGISNIYEKDFGDLSGWIYTVNGEIPSLGCSKYKLSPGDVVEWKYTLTP